MNKSLKTLLLLTVMASAKVSSLSPPLATDLTGPYLGQTPPGLTPEPFAQGVISTPGWEYSGVFSPDLTEFYYIKEVEREGQLRQEFIVYQQQNDRWYWSVISPRVGQPFVSPDGLTMHLGRRYKTRQGEDWSELKSLGEPFSNHRIMWLTSSANGTWVFDEAKREGDGLLRISRIKNGVRLPPEPLDKTINTGQWNAHPFIAPDESYIIWDGQRESPVRNADLFISFKQSDGRWGDAIKFDDRINTRASENGARVTPDGKYLFFNRRVGEFEYTHPSGKVEVIGNTDIFWVDAGIIESMRPTKHTSEAP